MKNYFLLLAAIMMCCSADENTPIRQIDNDNFDVSTATLLTQGMLEGVGHTASGTATVYAADGRKIVVLDPYESQSGPDLKVYLSKDRDATEYIRLGQLKATSGKQSYVVPGSPDINQYHYVHVWCEKYTVVFARAEMK
jgi:hypothetical protein